MDEDLDPIKETTKKEIYLGRKGFAVRFRRDFGVRAPAELVAVSVEPLVRAA